jgi:hypothetical protein
VTIAETLDHQREWVGSLKNSELFASIMISKMKLAESFYRGTDCYYFELVQSFTQRKLTFDNDRLDAFAGLARAIERRGRSRVFWGLPEDIFDHALLWRPQTIDTPKSRNRYFPTWSWASWPGAVTFPTYNREWLDGSWDLSQGTQCVRRKHPYWKFYSDGNPEKINQKHTRYSIETERREGITREDEGLNIILDHIVIDGKKVTDTYVHPESRHGKPTSSTQPGYILSPWYSRSGTLLSAAHMLPDHDRHPTHCTI